MVLCESDLMRATAFAVVWLLRLRGVETVIVKVAGSLFAHGAAICG